MRTILTILICVLMTHASIATEYFVSQKIGNDKNKGTQKSPFKTIQHAADIAIAGDTVTVLEGVYREQIVPKNGGKEGKPIIYQAAKDAKVEIKGSEIITGWENVEGDIWKAKVSNEIFGNFNPYQLVLTGDWYRDNGKPQHLGEVFLNSNALYEKNTFEELTSEPSPRQKHAPNNHLRWFVQSDEKETTFFVVFGKDLNPNEELVEISVRESCFYPDKEYVNYITIRGFEFSQAATQWAPPTQEQIGMIAARWCKGWIIEDNIISNSKSTGITLGKYSDALHVDQFPIPDPKKNGYARYIECVFRAGKYGWNKETIGGHIVRNNKIFDCGQTAICGSMGSAWSIIENNEIYGIYRFKEFGGDEMAGIKFHAAIDTIIRNNYIHHNISGLWLDWMTQDTQVVNNVFAYNDDCDIFAEVNHGPYFVGNNILASRRSIFYNSGGGAFVHNILGGFVTTLSDSRFTPYFFPHEAHVAGFMQIDFTDNRYFNNIFANRNNLHLDRKDGILDCFGLTRYDNIENNRLVAKGNIYFNTSRPSKFDVNYLVFEDFYNDLQVIEEENEIFLTLNLPEDFKNSETQIITTETLGRAHYPDAPFVNPDGSKIVVDKDMLGASRPAQPMAGPLEELKAGANKIKVWEKRK